MGTLGHVHRMPRLRPALPLTALAVAQEWLDARLEYVGFESRPFPQLLPLDLLLELGVNGEEASSVCTSHVFAHWAKSSSSLPVLASQWHDVDRSDAAQLPDGLCRKEPQGFPTAAPNQVCPDPHRSSS